MAAASTSGPPTLARSLWDEFGEAMRRGLKNLGTYNPSSRLPGGGPSDHSRNPSDAFDVGGTPTQLAQFFKDMIGRPGVNYVIYQDLIWSRSKGLHPYRSGGHETHVHVSGVPGYSGPSANAPITQNGGYGVSDLLRDARKVGVGANPAQISTRTLGALDDIPGVGSIPGVGAVSGVADAISAPGDAIRWVAGNWDRVLLVAGGFTLVVVGLVLMGVRLGVGGRKTEIVLNQLPAEATGRAPAKGSAAETRLQRPTRRVALPADRPRTRPAGAGGRQSDEIPF